MFEAHWKLAWLLALCLLHSSHGVYRIYTVYLNREEDCNHKIPYRVTKDVVFEVKADGDPNSTCADFIECTMTFTGVSDGPDGAGRLCVAEDQRFVDVARTGVEVSADQIFDGKTINFFTVDRNSHRNVHAESCSAPAVDTVRLSVKLQRRYLYEAVRERKRKAVDVKQIRVNLRILHISSRLRRLYLGWEFCHQTYILDHSEVSFYNRRTPEDFRERPHPFSQFCALTFRRHSSSERSICFMYFPLGEPDCSSNWTLDLEQDSVELDWDSQSLFSLSCRHDRNKAGHPFAYCAPRQVEQVRLSIVRTVNINPGQWQPERPEMFRFVVSDFPGDSSLEYQNYTETWLAQDPLDLRVDRYTEEVRDNRSEGVEGGEMKADTEHRERTSMGSKKGDSLDTFLYFAGWFMVGASAFIVLVAALVTPLVFWIVSKRTR